MSRVRISSTAPYPAPWPSGKAKLCKSFILQFESGWRLHFIEMVKRKTTPCEWSFALYIRVYSYRPRAARKPALFLFLRIARGRRRMTGRYYHQDHPASHCSAALSSYIWILNRNDVLRALHAGRLPRNPEAPQEPGGTGIYRWREGCSRSRGCFDGDICGWGLGGALKREKCGADFMYSC